MSVTNLTGTKWQFNSTLLPGSWGSYSDKYYQINATASAGGHDVSTDETYNELDLYFFGSNHEYFGAMMFAKQNYGQSERGFQFNGYDGVWYYSGGIGDYETSSAPTLEITGGSDVTNEELIAWLESNASQISTTTNKNIQMHPIVDGVMDTSTNLYPKTKVENLEGVTATTTQLNYCSDVEGNIQSQIDAKQATISDLSTIRSGAALGATALQSVPNTYRTSAAQDTIDANKVPTSRTVNGKALSGNITLNANDVSALPSSTSIPTKTSDLTNDSGFITSHQSLSAYRTASAQDTIDTGITNSIAAITEKIPSDATSSNQLADKAFVNSSITTNTSTFRGTSAKNLTEAQFLAWANTLTKTNNDYVFWDTVDEHGNTIFKRYKYNGSAWEYEYTLNNSSFTSAQWLTINSGLAAADKTTISTALQPASLNPYRTASAQDTIDASKVPTTRTVNGKALSSDITLTASDVSALPSSTAIPSKTSDLNNDSGFITDAYHDSSKYDASNPNGYTTNTGTVTSVAVKMNGATKGTVTSSGTIDMGTVTPLEAGTESASLNSLVNPGLRYIKNATNSPFATNFYGGVLTFPYNNLYGKTGANFASQIAIPTGDYSAERLGLYYRTANNDSWNAWKKVQDQLVSGTNLKTVNGNSLLGSGDIGTVTSVSVQMNGETKGTVTGSGSIDLGTVVTDTSTVPVIAYGTCDTAAGTAAKVVTITSSTKFELISGAIVGVMFSNTNTASSVTLNVNNTGAKSLYYNNAVYTGSSSTYTGYKNRMNFYMYNGTYWCFICASYLDGNTVSACLCTTAAATAAKTASCTNFYLLAKSYGIITIQYTNTAASALTLNINGQGAKSIYINGSASSTSNYTLPRGTYLYYYDGSKFYLRTDGKIEGVASLSGAAFTGNVSVAGTLTAGGNVVARVASFDSATGTLNLVG